MTISTTFLAVIIALDEGVLILADRKATIGSDRTVAAILSIDRVSEEGCGCQLERQAIPDEYQSSWWTNRSAMVIDCDPVTGSLYDGAVLFEGIVAGEPEETAGVLTLRFILRRERVVELPGLGVIDSVAYPLADPQAVGQHQPMIFGTVESCPLLPVTIRPATRLAEAAASGDGQLVVDDAGALPAAGSVWVDAHLYTYTTRTATALLGLGVATSHPLQTLVQQSGETRFLAAGHPITALAEVRCGDAPLHFASVDTAGAAVVFATPPRLPVTGERFELSMQFDAVAIGNTATNATNAIRAITNAVDQTATALPSGVTKDLPGSIVFARPNSDRIVVGVYTVAFAVVVAGQVGWARVSIGGSVVWAWEPGSGVVYNASGGAIEQDDDTDLLPVTVEIDPDGVAGVTVAITGASRRVYTGNLDDANYATVAPGQTLKVLQTTVNPDRGRIVGADLVVRWFATDAGLGTTNVQYDGHSLGALRLTSQNGASLSRTITVDVVSQGAAALPQQNISTVVSGGTSSLSHNTQTRYASVTAAMQKNLQNTWIYYRGQNLCPTLTGWDASLGAIVVEFVFTADGLTPASDFGNHECRVDLYNSGGGLIATLASASNATSLGDATWKVATTINTAPYRMTWAASNWNQGFVEVKLRPVAVNFAYSGRITAAAINLSSTGASGSSSPINAQSLSHSGTSVAVNNGSIYFAVPAPPRVLETRFPLAGYDDWDRYTNTTAEVALSGGSASLCVVQVYLAVAFDAITYREVGGSDAPVTATVTGYAGNPADTLAALAEATGEILEPRSLARLRAWATATGYQLARRIGQPTDALQLLTAAAEQSGVILARRQEGVCPIRWFDLASDINRIDEADLLNPATLSWDERIENNITLKYREDYAGDAGFIRCLVADPANNAHCRRSVAAIREARPVTIEAGWIRDDATATLFLADYARRYAQPRRLVQLDLPFTHTLQPGDLIEFRESVWRVTAVANDQGWPSITAEEITT